MCSRNIVPPGRANSFGPAARGKALVPLLNQVARCRRGGGGAPAQRALTAPRRADRRLYFRFAAERPDVEFPRRLPAGEGSAVQEEFAEIGRASCRERVCQYV